MRVGDKVMGQKWVSLTQLKLKKNTSKTLSPFAASLVDMGLILNAISIFIGRDLKNAVAFCCFSFVDGPDPQCNFDLHGASCATVFPPEMKNT